MAEVEFIYEEKNINIYCNKDDKMKDICEKFIHKSQIDKNSIYYLYNGDKINEELTFEKITNDNNINKITILVADSINEELNNNNNNLIESKNIICPICHDNIRIKIEDYKIKLYECRNNHIIDNIFLEEYQDTQNIDLSKIICEICKERNKGNSHDNLFYRCNKCKLNLCLLCKSKHDKNHNIIDFELKNYICDEHNEIFVEYCKECKKDICLSCEKKHYAHETIFYKNIRKDIEEIKNDINEYKKEIDIFYNNIDEIINKLNKVKRNMEVYYKIYNNIINNYELKNRNFCTLININEINSNIIKDIKEINNENNIMDKIKNILNLYNKMIFINDLNIIYKADNKDEKIRLFGEKFVENNKNKCKLLIDNIEYELLDNFQPKNNKEGLLKIKLIGFNNLSDISYIFYYCTSLLSLPDIFKWNSNKVTNLSYMFYYCESLSSLPDISKWNTSNVTDMNNMFYYCSSLSSLPDISKWDTSNVTDMNNMFYYCTSLSSLPDISKWDTSNVTDMNSMFYYCSSLSSLPDISKWNTNNVTNMSYIFYYCTSLLSLPDISKWNTNKVTNMNCMFYYCSSLSSLPDISKWDITNVTNISYMFDGCSSLSSLPDISKYNTYNANCILL